MDHATHANSRRPGPTTERAGARKGRGAFVAIGGIPIFKKTPCIVDLNPRSRDVAKDLHDVQNVTFLMTRLCSHSVRRVSVFNDGAAARGIAAPVDMNLSGAVLAAWEGGRTTAGEAHDPIGALRMRDRKVGGSAEGAATGPARDA